MAAATPTTPLLKPVVERPPLVLRDFAAQPAAGSLGEHAVVAISPDEGDLVLQAVADILHDAPLQDPKALKRLAFRLTAAGFSTATKIVFLPVFKELPGGPAWATFGSMGWFAFENWAANRIANQFWGPKLAREDIVVDTSQLSKCKLAGSALVAAVSKLPVVMIAYQYTGGNDAKKLLAAATTMISTSLVPSLSTISTVNFIRDNCCCCLAEPMEELRGKMLAMRGGMCSLLESNRRAFTRMNIQGKLGQVTRFLAIRDVAGINDQAGQFLELMLQSPATLQPPQRAVLAPSKCPPRSTMISRGAGIVSTALTGLSQGLLSTYTYFKAQEFIYENDYFGAALAGLVFTTGFYVSWTSSYRTNVSLTTAALARCLPTQESERELAWELYPLATGILSTLGALSTVAAAAYYWPVWADFCQEHEDWADLELFSQISTCAPIVLVIANCMLDLIPGIVKFVGERVGSQNKKDILVFNRMHAKLGELFQNLRFINWCIFVSKKCPPNFKLQLLAKYQVADEVLTKFIQDYSRPASVAASSSSAQSSSSRVN